MSTQALASLIAELPDGTVVTDPDIVASYRQDRAFDPSAGTALAVVRLAPKRCRR
jgi:glycolate oxidase